MNEKGVNEMKKENEMTKGVNEMTKGVNEMNELNLLTNTAMNENGDEKTMSSREIADITGKTHGNVMAAIRKVAEQLEADEITSNLVTYSIKSSTYKAGNGEQRNMYNLNKTACEVLMMGYSMKYRIAVHQRWKELEAQQQFSLPSNYIEALESLVYSEKEKQALALENAELKPQVAAFEAMTKVSGTISVSDYHKLLQSDHGIDAIQKEVREWLSDEGYIFRRNGEWHRYAKHSDKFEEKVVPWGNGRGVSWVIYLTDKGVRRITPRIVEYFKSL